MKIKFILIIVSIIVISSLGILATIYALKNYQNGKNSNFQNLISNNQKPFLADEKYDVVVFEACDLAVKYPKEIYAKLIFNDVGDNQVDNLSLMKKEAYSDKYFNFEIAYYKNKKANLNFEKTYKSTTKILNLQKDDLKLFYQFGARVFRIGFWNQEKRICQISIQFLKKRQI